MSLKKLPTRNVIIILMLGAGLLLFVLLSIFPNYIAYNSLTHEIEMLSNQVEEQKILSPIFEDLTDKARFDSPKNLPFPEKLKLPKDKTNTIADTIRRIVEGSQFKLENIVTDIDSLRAGSGILKMSINIVGEFMALRDVLLQLGELPYLEHIEIIHIAKFENVNKVMLKIWIAQEQ